MKNWIIKKVLGLRAFHRDAKEFFNTFGPRFLVFRKTSKDTGIKSLILTISTIGVFLALAFFCGITITTYFLPIFLSVSSILLGIDILAIKKRFLEFEQKTQTELGLKDSFYFKYLMYNIEFEHLETEVTENLNKTRTLMNAFKNIEKDLPEDYRIELGDILQKQIKELENKRLELISKIQEIKENFKLSQEELVKIENIKHFYTAAAQISKNEAVLNECTIKLAEYEKIAQIHHTDFAELKREIRALNASVPEINEVLSIR